MYHSAKTFYFAAESQDALNQWVEFIRQSALTSNNNTVNIPETEVNAHTLFSENDSSSEEGDAIVIKSVCTPSPQGSKESPQSSNQTKSQTSTPISTKSDRRYLGSLRKLTKGSLQFKSSSTNEKKVSNDIPVPTDQFRSYRKVPGGSFGIQIGANTPGYHDSTLHPYNMNAATAASSPTDQHQSYTNSTLDMVVPHAAQATPTASHQFNKLSSRDSSMLNLGPPSSPAPLPVSSKDTTPSTLTVASDLNSTKNIVKEDSPLPQQTIVTSPSKSIKKIPYNFIHASNPNLVEFDFQTSRTLDYNMPKINSANTWDALPTNIQGFVTLKDLMLQKQEEEAQEMYNNRVLLGVEKKEEYKRNAAQKSLNQVSESNDANQNCEDIKVSKTQSRSLPKPPDYEISFKPDDEDIQLTRTKEGLKLRDFGYELISGDEPLGTSAVNARQYLQTARQVSHHSDIHESYSSGSGGSNWKSRPFLLSSNKVKKNSTSSCSSSDFSVAAAGERRLGSFKKKGKLESFKTSSEKIFQFGKHSSSSSASGIGTTMTLPLNKKSSNIASDTCGNSGIKKSQTYNNDLKEKAAKYDAQRKNSAPMPIFAKLISSSSSAPNTNNKNDARKDKKNSNSPLLHHRSIFGHHNNTNNQHNTYAGRDYDHEIFSQIIFPKKNPNRKQSIITTTASNNEIITAPEVSAPPPPTKTTNSNANDIAPSASQTEYPNMECPPVFEPDIYSLDPNTSLLLRRNNNNNHNISEHENN